MFHMKQKNRQSPVGFGSFWLEKWPSLFLGIRRGSLMEKTFIAYFRDDIPKANKGNFELPAQSTEDFSRFTHIALLKAGFSYNRSNSVK